MMGHDFSRKITEKCGTKYRNGNYILEHPKWKWELYFGTEEVSDICFRKKGDSSRQDVSETSSIVELYGIYEFFS